MGKEDKAHDTLHLRASSLVNKKILSELNSITEETLSKKIHNYEQSEQSIFSLDAELSFSKSKIKKHIDNVFVGLFDDLLQVFREFPCDLVILSGKPSELSRIQEKIHDI